MSEPGEQADLHLVQGKVLLLLGRYNQVESQCREALALAQAAGDGARLARAQCDLGKLYLNRAEYTEAVEWLEQARAGWESLGDRGGVGEAVCDIGSSFWKKGEYEEARRDLQEGLVLVREAGN